MKLRAALTYELVPLSFGTSGLRGLATDMTDLECYINTRGFFSFLAESADLPPESIVYIAGDLRESTPRILRSVIKAVEDNGHKPVYCGLMPIPALAYYALKQSSPCIMVTGSHIPADRNGIKFYKLDGEVMKVDEPQIKKHVADMREAIYERDLDTSGFDSEGMMASSTKLPKIDTQAEKSYIERYALTNSPLEGKHIVYYEHSSVGRDLICRILEALGARVTRVGRSDVFISIDTENVTKEDKDYFTTLAKEYPDNFAIISTDGDSDRPFVIDETGKFHRGDVVGCVTAQEVGADFAAIPISSNDATDVFLEQKGIRVVHTKIGSPYVIEGMKSAENSKATVGWEVNGGFMHDTSVAFDGVDLRALPTRDALLPILAVLVSASKAAKKVSEVFASLPRRYAGGALLDNVDDVAIEKLRNLSGYQEQVRALIDKHLRSDELGEPTEVNFLDGARVYFSSGDIIHIRPSGNAPQLRVYTNCNTQKRADDLASSAVADGGLLGAFVKAIL